MNNIQSSIDFKIGIHRIQCIFDVSWKKVFEITTKKPVIITDENLYNLLAPELKGIDVIVLPAGEESKKQSVIDKIVNYLIQSYAAKDCILIGLGGGVVTDITGFVASIYMRGIECIFIPTSLLGMVDASIGGKNGINEGKFKNVLGTIYQPSAIIFDFSFLNTLPKEEWNNGMAEIIKYGCIADIQLIQELEALSIHQLQSDITLTASIIAKCLNIKMAIVIEDEFDKGKRRVLNFGHTFGHAIEKQNNIPHGHAVSLGIVAACVLSEKLSGLHFEEAARVVKLLNKYHLPVDIETDYNSIMDALKFDKKTENKHVHFILLNRIGEPAVIPVEFDYLSEHIKELV